MAGHHQWSTITSPQRHLDFTRRLSAGPFAAKYPPVPNAGGFLNTGLFSRRGLLITTALAAAARVLRPISLPEGGCGLVTDTAIFGESSALLAQVAI